MFLLLAISAPSQFSVLVMNMNEKMRTSFVLSASLGSPQVEQEAEEDGVDDIKNEFNYTHGSDKEMRQWKIRGRGEDVDLCIGGLLLCLTLETVFLIKPENTSTRRSHLPIKRTNKEIPSTDKKSKQTRRSHLAIFVYTGYVWRCLRAYSERRFKMGSFMLSAMAFLPS